MLESWFEVVVVEKQRDREDWWWGESGKQHVSEPCSLFALRGDWRLVANVQRHQNVLKMQRNYRSMLSKHCRSCRLRCRIGCSVQLHREVCRVEFHTEQESFSGRRCSKQRVDDISRATRSTNQTPRVKIVDLQLDDISIFVHSDAKMYDPQNR